MEEIRGEEGGIRVSPLVLIVCETALAVAWAASYAALSLPFPVAYGDHGPLTPLYAFAIPLFRPEALAFALLAALAVWGSARISDPERTRRGAFAAVLTAGALVLPCALFLVRQDPWELGTQFEIYRGDEFLEDAREIGSLGLFLDRYVESLPDLSLHGAHFPPGHAVFLYVVGKLFGFGTLAAGAAVLAAFAAGIVVAWLALEEIVPARAARQGALLLLACPSVLDFACTSMDGVFFLFAAIAWRAGLRAFSPRGSVLSASLAGAALLLAAFFSFSTLLVGFVLLVYGVLAGARTPRPTILRLLATGAAFAASALALDAATGFPIWTCLAAARENAFHLMERALHADPRSFVVQFSVGNLVAFSIGAGVALLVALTVRVRARPLSSEPWTPAFLVTLAAMSFGGIYFMETERAWLYAIPWLAAAGLSAGPFDTASLRRLLVAGFVQAFLMEVGLFTLW